MKTTFQNTGQTTYTQEDVFRRQRELLLPGLKYQEAIGRMAKFRKQGGWKAGVRIADEQPDWPRPQPKPPSPEFHRFLTELDSRMEETALEEMALRRDYLKEPPEEGGLTLYRELDFRQPTTWTSTLDGGGFCLQVVEEADPPPVDTGTLRHEVSVSDHGSRAKMGLYWDIGEDGCCDVVTRKVNQFVHYHLPGPTEDFRATDLKLNLWGLGYARQSLLGRRPPDLDTWSEWTIKMRISAIISQITRLYDPEADVSVSSICNYVPVRDYEIWQLPLLNHAESGILFDLYDLRFPTSFRLLPGDANSCLYAAFLLQTEIKRHQDAPGRLNFYDHPFGIYLDGMQLIDASAGRMMR